MLNLAQLDELLNLSSGSTVYASLHTQRPPTGQNELLNAGSYARQPVRGFEVAVVGGAVRTRFPTGGAVQFPTATANWLPARTVAFSASNVHGTDGPWYAWADALPGEPVTLLSGDIVRIEEDAFWWSWMGANWTRAGLEALARAVRVGGGSSSITWHVGLHTGTPVTTANELSGRGYARAPMDVSFANVGQDGEVSGPTSDVAFPDVVGGVAWTAPTHFGLWSAAVGGGVLHGSGPLSPPIPTPPADGHFRIPRDNFTVDFT